MSPMEGEVKISANISNEVLDIAESQSGPVKALMRVEVATRILETEYSRLNKEEEMLEIVVCRDGRTFVRKVTVLAEIDGAFSFVKKSPKTENLKAAIYNLVDASDTDIDEVIESQLEDAEKLILTLSKGKVISARRRKF